MTIETSSQNLWHFSDETLDAVFSEKSEDVSSELLLRSQPSFEEGQEKESEQTHNVVSHPVTPLPPTLPITENLYLHSHLPGLESDGVPLPRRPSRTRPDQETYGVSQVGVPRPIALHQASTNASPVSASPSPPHKRFFDELPHLEGYETTARFNVEEAAVQCGVPVMTLNLWERRYGIPAPWHAENSYKLYSDRDIAVAQWLRECIAHGKTVRQAMTTLLKLEPTYIPRRGSPPLHPITALASDLKALQGPLLRAFTAQQERLAEQILSDAFASTPVAAVCTQLLQPVLLQIVELRQRTRVPFAIELLAAKVTRTQVVPLVEAGLGPKEALTYLSSLVLDAPDVLRAMQNEHKKQGLPDLVKLEERLLIAIRNMDEGLSQRLLDEAFLHYSVEEVCLNLIQALLYRVGVLWAEKQVSIPIEHFATGLIRTRLSHLFQSTPNVQQGPAIFVGCAPKETHEIGVLMLALFWRRAGLNVFYLGQLVEIKSLIQEIRVRRPGIVCLSAMMRHHVKDLAEAARDITKMEHPRPVFCFGGGAFGQEKKLIQSVKGVYLGTNATMATQRIKELVRMQMSFSVEEIEGLGFLPK